MAVLGFSLIVSGCATQSKVSTSVPSKYSSLMGSDQATKQMSSIESTGVSTNEEAKQKAKEALQKNNLDLALYYFVRAVEFDNTDVSSLLEIARIHEARGATAPSLLAYRLVLEVEPENPLAMEKIGLGYLQANQIPEAKQLLEKVVTIAPDRPDALMGLAIIHDLSSEFDIAEKYYQQAIAIRPKSEKILNNYAYSRYLSGSLGEADRLYRELLRLYPRNQQGLLNYGLLKARQDKPGEALELFRRVLTEAQAYNELGYIYMMQNDYDKARQLFERAISASPAYFEEASRNLELLKSRVGDVTRQGVAPY